MVPGSQLPKHVERPEGGEHPSCVTKRERGREAPGALLGRHTWSVFASWCCVTSRTGVASRCHTCPFAPVPQVRVAWPGCCSGPRRARPGPSHRVQPGWGGSHVQVRSGHPQGPVLSEAALGSCSSHRVSSRGPLTLPSLTAEGPCPREGLA